MLVLSAGMQKSGSGLFYNAINDFLAAQGWVDAWTIRDKFGFSDIMLWENNNIRTISPRKTYRLWRTSVRENPFVVKTHRAPTATARLFRALGMMKIVYSYRDPRDVILSVMEHGKKNQKTGKSRAFTKLVEFDQALNKINEWGEVWRSYMRMKGICVIRYEDYMRDSEGQLRRIQEYLDLSLTDHIFRQICSKYGRHDPGKKTAELLHFNNPGVAKYRREMTPEQQNLCREVIGDLIAEMGYEL